MIQIAALRELPPQPPYKKGDVLVVFGELFSRGYANGIVDEAEKAGLTVIRSTVGRRDENDQIRALTSDEAALVPKPFINVPLEAGFDMEKAIDGLAPIDRLQGIKMAEWDQVKLDWSKIEESRSLARKRFQNQVQLYIKELKAYIPKGANVIFAHIMAGGVPRAKIMMPTMNRIFKGQGDRHLGSEALAQSDLGKFSQMNFEDVTAQTFQYLLEGSAELAEEIKAGGGSVRYLAYGYHGTEVLINGQYTWQTYTPYFQGWAKMRLEDFAKQARAKGLSCCVYNCPEILTNSSSIFLGVEVSLYPLLSALKKQNSAHAQAVVKECEALLKDGLTTKDVLEFTDSFMNSEVMKPFNSNFAGWPLHNSKQQMELMLQASAHLIDMHKDPKNLITYILSEEVFKATGLCMFRDSWQPQQPVLWLGHDIVAKAISAQAASSSQAAL